MSFADLDPETRAIARHRLTPKQYEAFVLECAGVSTARIAVMLDISRRTVRTHLERAHQVIDVERRSQ